MTILGISRMQNHWQNYLFGKRHFDTEKVAVLVKMIFFHQQEPIDAEKLHVKHAWFYWLFSR
jgi:hypothetical protein